MSGSKYVLTDEILAAVKGRETDLIDALGIRWRRGRPHITCPYAGHPDKRPSWRWDDSKARAYCTCITPSSHSVFIVLMKFEEIPFEQAKIRAAELLGLSNLIRERRNRRHGEGGDDSPPAEQVNNATPAGCTLAGYSAAKQLPIEFLLRLGIRDISYQGVPAIRIPYFGGDGGEPAVRFRVALDGDRRFAWRKGEKPRLYGLERLGDVRKAGYVVLVEGESDCHTLWHHGLPALGLPGNLAWNEERDAALLSEIPIVYVVIEPDKGGEGVLNWLSRSAISSRARLVRLPVKDPSALHCLDPDGFRAAFEGALATAEPYQPIPNRLAAQTTKREHGLELSCAAEITPRPVEWLWPKRIALGKVTMAAGHPEFGKSQLVLGIAATVTTGGPFPAENGRSRPGSVVIMSAEDDPEDTIRPRLEAAKADLKRCHIICAVHDQDRGGCARRRGFSIVDDLARLDIALQEIGDAKLVIIDPITAYLGATDSYRTAEVWAVLAPLADLAIKHRVAIVAVSHLNKSSEGEALLKVTGSLAFVAAARAAYVVTREPEDDGRRLFLPLKNNLGTTGQAMPTGSSP